MFTSGKGRRGTLRLRTPLKFEDRFGYNLFLYVLDTTFNFGDSFAKFSYFSPNVLNLSAVGLDVFA